MPDGVSMLNKVALIIQITFSITYLTNLVQPRRLFVVDARPTAFVLQRSRHDGSSSVANIRLPSHSGSIFPGKVPFGIASLQDLFIPFLHTRPIALGSPISYGLEKFNNLKFSNRAKDLIVEVV